MRGRGCSCHGARRRGVSSLCADGPRWFCSFVTIPCVSLRWHKTRPIRRYMPRFAHGSGSLPFSAASNLRTNLTFQNTFCKRVCVYTYTQRWCPKVHLPFSRLSNSSCAVCPAPKVPPRPPDTHTHTHREYSLCKPEPDSIQNQTKSNQPHARVKPD